MIRDAFTILQNIVEGIAESVFHAEKPAPQILCSRPAKNADKTMPERPWPTDWGSYNRG